MEVHIIILATGQGQGAVTVGHHTLDPAVVPEQGRELQEEEDIGKGRVGIVGGDIDLGPGKGEVIQGVLCHLDEGTPEEEEIGRIIQAPINVWVYLDSACELPKGI